MSKQRSIIFGSLLALLLTGCTSPVITNLTPSRSPRKTSGQYPFAVEFVSRQQSMIKSSLQAYVVIGDQLFPMQRIPMLTNRWETLVPIPPTTETIAFHYKFDYKYRAIPSPETDNVVSKTYQLKVLESK
jgi:hypothetical protein